MASVNTRAKRPRMSGHEPVRPPRTYEGGPAVPNASAMDELERMAICSLLWEDNFYVDGISHADRIAALCKAAPAYEVAKLAVYCRTRSNLRHMPLWLWVSLAEANKLSGLPFLFEDIAETLVRPDDVTELFSLWWRNGKRPLPNSFLKAARKAFKQWDGYQLAKYHGRAKSVKLQDVMRLCHPKPVSPEQGRAFQDLNTGTLRRQNTWEDRLSSGEDKGKVFTDLLKTNSLGAMALLRNLRNMIQAGVDTDLIMDGLRNANYSRVLPYRFIAAAKYAPRFEEQLEQAMLKSLSDMDPLAGETVLLVDTSWSMSADLSRKSDMTRLDAACGLAIMLRELCANVRVYTFNYHAQEVAPRRGFALRDAIGTPDGGTYLWKAVQTVQQMHPKMDRLVTITDEQSFDTPCEVVVPKHYLVNVANYKNGVDFGDTIGISGWSEHTVRFIQNLEKHNAFDL